MPVDTVDDAIKTTQLCVLYWVRVQEALKAGDVDSVVQETRTLLGLVPPGLYEHFKSREHDPKFYIVYGITPNVDGKTEPTVHYVALYGPFAGLPASRFLFHQDHAFWGPIVRPNDPEYPYEGPRFKLIRKLAPFEIAELQSRATRDVKVSWTRTETLAYIDSSLPIAFGDG